MNRTWDFKLVLQDDGTLKLIYSTTFEEEEEGFVVMPKNGLITIQITEANTIHIGVMGFVNSVYKVFHGYD